MRKLFSAKTILTLGTAMLLATQASFAATVSDAGATDLKKQVEEAMAVPLGMGKATGSGLLMDGAVEVAVKGDYYEVKLPSLAYGANGFKADLGTLTLHVTPGDNDEYKVTLELPKNITVMDPQKQAVAEISIGDQLFQGIYHPSFRCFTKIGAEYKDIKVVSKQSDKFTMTIADMKSTLDLGSDSNGTYSGPAKFQLSQMHMVGGDKGQFDMTIASMDGAATYDKINMQSRKDMEDKTGQVLQGMAKGEKMTDEQVQQMLSSLMSSIQNYLNGMGSSFKAANVDIKINPAPDDKSADGKPAKAAAVHLNSMSWAFDMAGMQQQKGNVSVKFGMDGLSMTDIDPGTASVVPTATNVEIHLDDLPMQALSQGLSGLLSQVMQSAVATQGVTDAAQKSAMQAQVQAQVMQAMTTIPAQLATAGSKLSIVNTFAKAPDVGTTLDGSFTASAASPVLAQGSMTLLITGLDELIVKLQTLAQSPNGDAKLISWAQGLGMLQLMGKASKAADGRSQRVYKLDVSADGKVLLNDQPLQNAMGGMGAMGGMPPQGGPDAMSPAPMPEKSAP